MNHFGEKRLVFAAFIGRLRVAIPLSIAVLLLGHAAWRRPANCRG